MAKQLHWDDVLALGYAAEQLFFAAQLLTSDMVPLDQAVHAACERHIGGLLRLKHLLPAELVHRLEGCRGQCPTSGPLSRVDAEQLGRRLLTIFEDLRRVLNQVAEQGSEARLLDAA
ncbi:MAG TPA: hypothetical protein VE998_05520 [Terriglobales bacterium]|nr:hypothetical protein [Terriglobales bacterium]